MLGKLFEYEADKNKKYYRVIQTVKKYNDGKRFPIDDNFAMQLYLKSTLSEKSYFKAMTAVAICGYMDTALKVCEDKVNKENVNIAIYELEEFCKRRKQEHMITDPSAIERIHILLKKLKDIRGV